uniref:Guanine nucleotide exchange factor VAV2 n=1 Tax=Magallana gigas TaxID=29159 RepID=A0A8W8MAX7_MAGGI
MSNDEKQRKGEKEKRYKQLIETQDEYDDYVENHKRDGEYATDPLVQAAADKYDLCIHVSKYIYYNGSTTTQLLKASPVQLSGKNRMSGKDRKQLYLKLENDHYTFEKEENIKMNGDEWHDLITPISTSNGPDRFGDEHCRVALDNSKKDTSAFPSLRELDAGFGSDPKGDVDLKNSVKTNLKNFLSTVDENQKGQMEGKFPENLVSQEQEPPISLKKVRYTGSSNDQETSHGNEKPFISLRSAKDPVDQNIGSGTEQDSISKPSTPETKEDFCVKELLDTEEKYVDTLRMIHLQFNEGLRDVVLQADRDVIFSHIEKLLIIHQKFQAELQSPFTSGIGEVFVKYKKSFLLYGNYCSDLQKAQERLKEITRRNKNVRTGIENCEQQSNPGKFKLRDLLYVPMQRVLKYHLLLSELFKHSEKEAKDKDSLKQGLEAMKDLSLYINEVKRDSETLQKIDKLQSSIRDLQMPANTTLKDYGRLQKEGELNVSSHTNNKIRSRYIFLFDKVMLICKAKRVGAPFKGESYFRFKETITLTEYNVQDMQPANRDTKHRGDKVLKWNSSFIMRKKGNQIHALSFFAKTENMNAEWIGAVNLALENASPPQGINYVMHTFDQPTECSVCGKLLRGIFFQGYKCTDPGSDIAVHKECIGKQPDTGSRGNPNAGGGRPALHFQKDEENKSKKVFAGPTKEDIIRSIKAVKSETLDDFRSSAKELIAELQAEDALAAALALISGSTKITSHSMLSSKEELVELCGENSMADSFPGVDTTPKSHFKTQSGGSANTLILGYAEAVYDYAATATSQLSLCRGDKVAILSKKESEKGWWKGENCDSGKNGYFPLKYVSELC